MGGVGVGGDDGAVCMPCIHTIPHIHHPSTHTQRERDRDARERHALVDDVVGAVHGRRGGDGLRVQRVHVLARGQHLMMMEWWDDSVYHG